MGVGERGVSRGAREGSVRRRSSRILVKSFNLHLEILQWKDKDLDTEKEKSH